MNDIELTNEIISKVRVIRNLPEAGFAIRAEARIADEALRVEAARHNAELVAILERLNGEAWSAVDVLWSEEERKAAL